MYKLSIASTMTIVIAAIAKNGIVISSDGYVQNEHRSIVQHDFEKIRLISNEFCIAISGHIQVEDLNWLIKKASKKVYTYPFKLIDIAKNFADLATYTLTYNQENYGIEFIIAGYDKDQNGSSIFPCLYKLTQQNNKFIINSSRRSQKIAIGKKIKLDMNKSSFTKDLIKDLHRKIQEISEKDPLIGSPYCTFIINTEGIKKELSD